MTTPTFDGQTTPPDWMIQWVISGQADAATAANVRTALGSSWDAWVNYFNDVRSAWQVIEADGRSYDPHGDPYQILQSWGIPYTRPQRPGTEVESATPQSTYDTSDEMPQAPLTPEIQPGPLGNDDEIIAKWIQDYQAGAFSGLSDADLLSSLSTRLGRAMTQAEFDGVVRPELGVVSTGAGAGAGAGEAPPYWELNPPPEDTSPLTGPDDPRLSDLGGAHDPRLPYFREQSPGAAYTRYLAMQEGLPPAGTFGRNVLESRGDFQSALAPGFGYGIPLTSGGKGNDFVDFYKRYGAQGPSYADIQGQARNIQGSLYRESDEMRALTQQQMEENRKAGVDPFTGVGYDAAVAGTYDDPRKQFAFTTAGLSSQFNPYWQPGLEQQLGRRFNQLQATQPTQRWLDYAISRGLI